MSKHTEGPWEYKEVPGALYSHVASEKYITAGIPNVHKYWPERVEEQNANGHLIAAAPELLEALKGAHKELCDACCPKGWTGTGPRPHESLCRETTELIEKAEGKAMV